MNTPAASETIYTVVLPAFAGPLELLLRLIERAELDITTIALAQVADQYLAHVRALRDPDPGALSAFLLIAARLLVIKSRALPPQPPAAPDEPDDAADLMRQLQEYQRFRQAAGVLRARIPGAAQLRAHRRATDASATQRYAARCDPGRDAGGAAAPHAPGAHIRTRDDRATRHTDHHRP